MLWAMKSMTPPPCELERLSTADAEPAQRFDAWRERAHRWVDLLPPLPGTELDAELLTLRSDACLFGIMRSTAYEVRAASHRASNEPGMVVLTLIQAGHVVRDAAPGEHQRMSPGMLGLYDTQRPGHYRWGPNSREVFLALPRTDAAAALGREPGNMLITPAQCALVPLLSGQLDQLAQLARSGRLDAEDHAGLLHATHALALLTLRNLGRQGRDLSAANGRADADAAHHAAALHFMQLHAHRHDLHLQSGVQDRSPGGRHLRPAAPPVCSGNHPVAHGSGSEPDVSTPSERQAALLAFAPAAVGQIAALAAGAAAGLLLGAGATSDQAILPAYRISRRFAALCLLAYGALLALSFSPAATPLAGLGAAFYRSGALVFGGGHVVLPLLREAVVAPGWMTDSAFLTGYGAAQALPGPLFSIAAYLGALAAPSPGAAGAAVALVAIFLPGLLAFVGVLPFWGALRASSRAQSALAGVNAAVVGLLAAALYDPVWTSAVLSPRDFLVAVAGFVTLVVRRTPPLLVVAGCALAGVAIALAAT